MTREPVPESTTDGAARLDLDARPDAARAGRRFVEQQALDRGAAAMVDDVVLVAAELLANACQHAAPPIAVAVCGDGDMLRVEVADASQRTPVRAADSATTMTGRGLGLIATVATRWGVERTSTGKVVWAEFEPAVHGAVDASLDEMLARWDDAPTEGGQRFTVVLGDVPTDLLIAAKAHIDNLVREFSLAATAESSGGVEVPADLARLIETVVHGFAEARDSIKRQSLAAARSGQPRTRLTLHLPVSAADDGDAYLAALDEADEYARAARLLTLETPPEHRLFRRWYVSAVVRQLRAVAAGGEPGPVVPFEDVLVAEIRRLSVAQRASVRVSRLQRVTAALARARTPEDVAAVVVSEGVDALGASGGGLLVPAGDGEHIAVPGAVGYAEDLVDAIREERLDAPLPAATALRTGASVWLETQEERDRHFPDLFGFESSTVAMCAVPLAVGGRLLGALRFSFSTRKLFDDDERDFVLALAAQTAHTLARTESYAAERQAALGLQRALLPQHVPVIPGWEIATYYSPAGEQEAGGDFYDVLELPDGRVVAILGDVMGRGVAAAAAMALIRSTIRAYAADDPDPVSVFTRVDGFFEVTGFEQLVTVLYFLIDPDRGVVQVANAGHLPPLAVDADGARVVRVESGMPFGVLSLPREASSLSMPPGSALAAFTDGLVERRGADIDDGIDHILDGIQAAHGCDADEMLRRMLSASSTMRAVDDDVSAVVLRRV